MIRRKKECEPCIPVPASDPWRPIVPCACRFLVRRLRLRPIHRRSTHELDKESLIAAVKCRYDGETYNSQLIEWPRGLDILQRLAQRLNLLIHSPFRLLRALDRLSLKRLNGLQLPVHIIRHGLELLEMLFDLVDHGSVVERGPVFGEIDSLRLLLQGSDLTAGVIVALFECLEGGGGGAFEAKGGGDAGPVDLRGCGTLEGLD